MLTADDLKIEADEIRGVTDANGALRNVSVVLSNRHVVASSGGKLAVGTPHFSLSLQIQRILPAISLLGIRALVIERPEIYSTAISRRFIGASDERLVHVAFGDYASLRIMKSAYNIAHVSWEYGAIATGAGYGVSTWKNQKWILDLFDEIWVGSDATRDAFVAHGLGNVHVVPIPVPDSPPSRPRHIVDVIGELPCVSLLFDFTRDMQTTRDLLDERTVRFADFIGAFALRGAPSIYLTIVNPGDHRKNVEATILGFVRFASENPSALLIVKLVATADKSLSNVLWNMLRLRLERLVRGGVIRSDAVVFVAGFLQEQQLMQLIQMSDFYISTSFAEGQNLPVLEAMSVGAIVISPLHTAMASYLNHGNCIPCKYRTIEVSGQTVTGYPVGNVEQYEVTVSDVVEALSASAALPAAELGRRRANGLATIEGAYDFAGVAAKLRARFEAINDLVSSYV